MKTENKIRAFLTQKNVLATDVSHYVVHPAGLVALSKWDTGFTSDLYNGACPFAVLSDDAFSDALHHMAEKHLPKEIKRAVDDRIVKGELHESLRDTVALVLDCVDWSAVTDEWNDAHIESLACPGGSIQYHTKKDGFWLITRPSGNLITALIELNPKAHAKWLARPSSQAA